MNPKKVLVVDDDAVIQKVLLMRLKRAGYEVLVAEDGAAAVTTARQARPDVILLDLNFPADILPQGLAWDGFLILAWLRRLEEAKDTPVIVVSVDHSDQAEKRAREAGAFEFCTKPIDYTRLLAAIERALGPVLPQAA